MCACGSPLGVLVLVDEYVGVVFQDRFDSLWIARGMRGRGKRQAPFRRVHDRLVQISLTLFCNPASAMPFIWPFIFGAICPKSVGPNTIAKFCTDIAFSDSCWTILDEKGQDMARR